MEPSTKRGPRPGLGSEGSVKGLAYRDVGAVASAEPGYHGDDRGRNRDDQEEPQ